jgi:hypothetical protein
MKKLIDPKITQESLIALRDEIYERNMSQDNLAARSADWTLVWKINSCLYRGYPHKYEDASTTTL